MHQRFFSVPDLKPTLMSNQVTVCSLCAAACSCILLKLMFSRPKNVSSRKTAEIEKKKPEFVSCFSIFLSVSFWMLFFFCFKSQGPTLLSWTQHVWRRERLFFCTVRCVLFFLCAATFLSFANHGAFCSHRRCLHVYFNFFFSCCSSPLNSTNYCSSCACVCVRACVCVWERVCVRARSASKQ